MTSSPQNTIGVKRLTEKVPIVLLSFVCLNILVKSLPIFRGIMIHPDAPVYLWAAKALERGEFREAISFHPMLLYPYLIMILHKIGIDWLFAGRFISIVASSISIVPFFAICRKFSYGWKLYTVSLLFIFLPELNFIGYTVLRDPLFLCLSLFCVFYALEFLENKSLINYLLALVFSIFLPFLRVEGVVVALLVNLWCIFYWLTELKSRKLVFFFPLLSLVVLLAFFVLFGENILTLLRFGFVQTFIEEATSGSLAVNNYLDSLGAVKQNPPGNHFASNFWQVIERHWLWIFVIGLLYTFVEILGWPLLFMVVAGFFVDLKQGDLRKIFLHTILVGLTLTVFIHYLVKGFLEVRFLLLPSVLFLFSLPSILDPINSFFYDKIRFFKPMNRKFVSVLIGCLLIGPFAYDSVFHRYRIHIPVLRDACLWVKHELLKSGAQNWDVRVNARRTAWFLDRNYKDKELTGKLDAEDIERAFMKKILSPTVFVLLLSTRHPSDISLMDIISNRYPETSQIFRDSQSRKNAILVVWSNLAE